MASIFLLYSSAFLEHVFQEEGMFPKCQDRGLSFQTYHSSVPLMTFSSSTQDVSSMDTHTAASKVLAVCFLMSFLKAFSTAFSGPPFLKLLEISLLRCLSARFFNYLSLR
ncbi:hypothetical protein Pst134EA_019052 [Puccinia striiformis f. sp. tritici]|uniref:hypothetical protein n=1 Tax=Puccinia striiformis f. sp. tritici TaxID=168172 RepID=UPI002008A361|nr:hypothetical protein Pst134EA_019052 [Puccinia striiformis f. sp. tritici]KAH9449140.1 hypothetical protein Pst134EB_019974 [Puccinia striiformis f. sp. tritici]KAH9458898.1 hypothetical protein Pst134EA_019052 [Puccinia striiformis f. sp. tritici]